MTFSYYDKVVRGTETEDNLVILQFLKGMVGQVFSFLNYYKEIPVSYDARLLSVENGMVEFEVHEYQAKVITLEKKALIRAHEKSPVSDDLVGDVFYVNVARKRAILTNFHYARIRSDLRRFVRVCLEGHRADADLHCGNEVIAATVRDISLGGVALRLSAEVPDIASDAEVNLILKLETKDAASICEIGVAGTVTKIVGDAPDLTCIMEFHPDRHSQQALAYYINQRQVEIIRELKEFAA
ncbi:MAG: PilZ domain-containing protein [Geobacter sp.]|nr:PilZ domain-containing protein [Geobacter sp.]